MFKGENYNANLSDETISVSIQDKSPDICLGSTLSCNVKTKTFVMFEGINHDHEESVVAQKCSRDFSQETPPVIPLNPRETPVSPKPRQ